MLRTILKFCKSIFGFDRIFLIVILEKAGPDKIYAYKKIFPEQSLSEIKWGQGHDPALPARTS